jgi:uncharacterized protein (TIGR03435 family)
MCLVALAPHVGYGPRVASFEVPSVKPVTPEEQSGQPVGLFTYPGGRIRATNYTLRMLIHDAYGVEMNQIVGGPTWIDSDRYVIEGKAPVSSPSGGWVGKLKTPPNPMRQMLQSLLAGRFELRLHRELKTESVYALVVARRSKTEAPKDATPAAVRQFRPDRSTAEAISQTLIGQNTTMDQPAVRLSQHLRRPVLNRTGIHGNFDFLIEYAARDPQREVAAPLVRAIQDQVGLNLETQPGSVEVLLIDQAKKPSGNRRVGCRS